MAEITTTTIIIAVLGGILPAFIWLWFWHREDEQRPEPTRLIVAAFVAGALIIPIVLFLERLAAKFIAPGTTLLVVVWATIEEVMKYLAAYVVAFRGHCVDGTQCLDEPVDPLIYLITAALGFAAVENALFLLTPISNGDAIASIITGDLRFIGAMLLHVVASGAIGVTMGLTYYKSAMAKRLAIVVGLFTASVLHILFNLSIIRGTDNSIFITFGFLWLGAVILLLLFEKIKRVQPR